MAGPARLPFVGSGSFPSLLPSHRAAQPLNSLAAMRSADMVHSFDARWGAFAATARNALFSSFFALQQHVSGRYAAPRALQPPPFRACPTPTPRTSTRMLWLYTFGSSGGGKGAGGSGG